MEFIDEVANFFDAVLAFVARIFEAFYATLALWNIN